MLLLVSLHNLFKSLPLSSHMNKTQLLSSLKAKGFSSKIIDAFSKVKRENFIPPQLKPRAYEDTALPIGEIQTISQPYTIAMMFSFGIGSPLLNPEFTTGIVVFLVNMGFVLVPLLITWVCIDHPKLTSYYPGYTPPRHGKNLKHHAPLDEQ